MSLTKTKAFKGLKGPKSLRGTKAESTQNEITTELLLKTFLDTKNQLGVDAYAELEIRFGNKTIEKISKNKFDSTIKYLLSKNFMFENTGVTYLNISVDNIRIKINNAVNIQKFCNTNQLPENDDAEKDYTYMKKTQYMINENNIESKTLLKIKNNI